LATRELDTAVRLQTFNFLRAEMTVHGDVLPRTRLAQGFQFHGTRVPLLGPQGIFKPALLDVPLSITTAPVEEGKARPYDDSMGYGGLLTYRYRGTDPKHRDNVGLRTAMQQGLSLVYFFGIVPGLYLPVFPVRIVDDNPGGLAFSVSLEEAASGVWETLQSPDLADNTLRRRYSSVVVQKRLHQLRFRQRVLRAYQSQCAMCRLRHEELLEAAHIIPDREELGEPSVDNGLALCNLHHKAFDRHILGLRPDLVVEVRSDILHEIDGPMLRYGLQGMNGVRILVPRSTAQRPNPDLVVARYEKFKKAG